MQAIGIDRILEGTPVRLSLQEWQTLQKHRLTRCARDFRGVWQNEIRKQIIACREALDSVPQTKATQEYVDLLNEWEPLVRKYAPSNPDAACMRDPQVMDALVGFFLSESLS